MRVMLLAITALGLAACETTEEWSEWEPITAEHSLIAVSQPAGVDLPDIARWRREKRFPPDMEEQWQWSGGIGSLVRLAPGYNYSFSSNDPDVLLETYRFWPVAEEEGIEIERAEVARRRNDIGFYFYATGYSSSGRTLCFFGTQGLQARQAPETMATPGTSGGYISLQHCVDGDVSQAAVVADMTAILDNLSLR